MKFAFLIGRFLQKIVLMNTILSVIINYFISFSFNIILQIHYKNQQRMMFIFKGNIKNWPRTW